tara:strand:- start:179 stop:388 length:210 start_codon:yes stop_codon:yes gene_type:complete
MTIKELIENLQTIAESYGDYVQITIAFEDFSENIRYSEMALINYNVSYSIRLDNMKCDKFDDKLVIKIG